MPKNLTPLVINTSRAQAAGSEFVWNKLQGASSFIASIVTPDVNIESSEELSRLVSGIPTPFARPAMFKYAINYVSQGGDELSGLMKFYTTLQDEWKGLVACIALDNQPISVEKVMLQYSDGRAAEDTANIYEPKGTLGNMLFDGRALWCDQLEHTDSTKRAIPFIYIIRYNGLVVGGTSPESLLFTAPIYDINTRKSFYNQVTKKFTDPLKANLPREEVEKLYVYVRHLIASMQSYEDQFTKKKPELSSIKRFLPDWLEDIESYAAKKGYEKLDPNAIVPNLNKFKAPFDSLFNFQTTLYGYGGRISTDKTALQLPSGVNPVEVELAELLLNPETCTVGEVLPERDGDVDLMGVHLLRAQSDKRERYFTLPLSEKGLAIFQDELEGLLQVGGELKSHLSGVYDMATKTLQITLQVDVNGNTTSFAKSYKEPVRIQAKKVMCWPDFVSPVWGKYYLYSELPHNGPELKAFPLRADKNKDGFRLLTDEEGGRYQFRKIAVNGKKLDQNDSATILVEYDMNKIGSTELKYEIYESSNPFKGVEVQFKTKPAGYVLFKSLTSRNPYALKDYRSERTNLDPVRVGFDFGSNNICISHAKPGGSPDLITFKNRRRCILGVDSSNRKVVVGAPVSAAAPDEVFFFQEQQTQSNQIKSMVMIHDERRISDIEPDPKIALKLEVKGGFPVFQKNIPIDKSEETTYTTWVGTQQSYIKFNMKWSNDDKENAYKQGLLRVLWLKTCAELLDQGRYAESLIWAYPSSMGNTTLNKYNNLWAEVGQLNPLKALGDSGYDYTDANVARYGNREFRAQTEAESVCKHALGVNFQTGDRGLIIGLDVGGSTTDILCVALKKDRASSKADDFKDTLIKEGSIRFAAGRLADATTKSKKFQEVLRSFCRKKGLSVHGITAGQDRLNGNTSSYYFNLIVDQLNTEAALNEFYRNLVADCPDLFTINAFMTGLVMFYAGQLAFRIRMSQEDAETGRDYLDKFDDVMIGCFGKGGRMFDWLRAMNDEAAYNYYKNCFYSGYGVKANDHIRRFLIKPADVKYVKAEVSFGLSWYKDIHVSGDTITELIGEDGFTYNGATIDAFAPVEPRFLQHFGNQFSTPREFKKFTEFAEIFQSFTKEYFGFSFPTMEQEINGMRLKAYVENIPDYQLAKRNPQDTEKFDFEAPIIILEGMCFLDTVLSQKLFGQ